jgi:hypothetical protein
VLILHPGEHRAIYHLQPSDTASTLEWVSGLAARDQYPEQENAEKPYGA